MRSVISSGQSRFGENDYIDLLGDGSLHPAQLQVKIFSVHLCIKKHF
jgi:hypothetical protein